MQSESPSCQGMSSWPDASVGRDCNLSAHEHLVLLTLSIYITEVEYFSKS